MDDKSLFCGVLGKYTDPTDHRPNTQTFNFLIIFSIRKIHRPFGKIHRPHKPPNKTHTILILVHLVIRRNTQTFSSRMKGPRSLYVLDFKVKQMFH